MRYKIVFVASENAKNYRIEIFTDAPDILDAVKNGLLVIMAKELKLEKIEEIHVTESEEFTIVDGRILLSAEAAKTLVAYWEHEYRDYLSNGEPKYIKAVDHPKWMVFDNKVKVGFFRAGKNVFSWAKNSGDWAAINLEQNQIVFSQLHEITNDISLHYALNQFTGEKLFK